MSSQSKAFFVSVADYSKEFDDLRSVRVPVFVEEQRVPIEEEWDALDPQCEHVIARDEHGKAIGTGRLTPHHKIGRMAVLKDWRGAGVGAALLQALIDRAEALGWSEVKLNSQYVAAGFYEKFGFSVCGEAFLEAGIRHVPMSRPLNPAMPERPPGAAPRASSTDLIETHNAHDVISVTAQIIRNARRHIWVHTRTLEKAIYGSTEVQDAFRHFATQSHDKMVYIIVQEPAVPSREHNPLLALSQRLSSVFVYRTPIDSEDLQTTESYLVTDTDGYSFRPLASRFEGTACVHGPARARQLQSDFASRWERAQMVTELRALGI